MNNVIFSTIQIKTENFKIIDNKQFNSTNNTVYQIASCSKFITSIVVGKLYESGKLDYDTDINKYLIPSSFKGMSLTSANTWVKFLPCFALQ